MIGALELVYVTMDVVGSVLIGWAALSVHWRLMREHHVDKKVEVVMGVERRMGMLGIALVIGGYILFLSELF